MIVHDSIDVGHLGYVYKKSSYSNEVHGGVAVGDCLEAAWCLQHLEGKKKQLVRCDTYAVDLNV